MSNVRSQPLHGEARISWNRIAAIISWLIGVLFTYLLLRSVAPALSFLGALGIALGSQLLRW